MVKGVTKQTQTTKAATVFSYHACYMLCILCVTHVTNILAQCDVLSN